RGGVTLAAGNFDGNAANGDELAVAAGPTGGPQVRVFGGDGTPVANFMAFNSAFRGGAAFGPVGSNGQLVVTAGPGGTGSSSFVMNADGTVTPTVLVPFVVTPISTGGTTPSATPASTISGLPAVVPGG